MGKKAITKLYGDIKKKMDSDETVGAVDIDDLQPFKAFKWLLDSSEVDESRLWIAKICDNAAAKESSSETAIVLASKAKQWAKNNDEVVEGSLSKKEKEKEDKASTAKAELMSKFFGGKKKRKAGSGCLSLDRDEVSGVWFLAVCPLCQASVILPLDMNCFWSRFCGQVGDSPERPQPSD